MRKSWQTDTDWRQVRAHDRALVVACLDGSETAWSALWERYGPLVKATARRAGCSDEEAREVVQRVGLVAVRKLATLEDGGKLGGWLAAIARNQSLVTIRERSCHVPLDPETSVPDLAADELLERAQRLAEVRQAFLTLEPRCQRILQRLDLSEGQSYAAVAEDEGLATSSIGPIRRRCLQRLREILLAVSRSQPDRHCREGEGDSREPSR